ncbi:MAG: hypothetical protein RIQ28_1779 [Pseudomonadota bacterium]
MARRCLGAAPVVQHGRGNPLQFGILLFCANIAGQFKPVAIGIEEVDRPENTVPSRAQHLNPLRLDMRLGGFQCFEIADLEGQMLHPFGRLFITAHFRLVGQFEKSEHIATPQSRKMCI